MSVVRKKARSSSVEELQLALEKFIPLLETQNDNDAVADLSKSLNVIKTAAVDSNAFNSALAVITDAFTGEHELEAYTFHRANSDASSWTIVDELFMASTAVWSLAKRLHKSES